MNQETVQVDGTSEVKFGFLVGDGKGSSFINLGKHQEDKMEDLKNMSN
jgi:hypothetical protein